MSRLRSLLCLLALLHACGASAFEQAPQPVTGTLQVVFTPGEDAAGLIVQAIGQAQKQVLVQAFSFTHREIAHALVAAHRRGVEVELVADAEQTRKTSGTQVAAVAAGGVPTYIDDLHDSAHNKVMIIDAETASPVLITGSFNFSFAAQRRNAENLLVFRGNREITAAYLANWQRHRGHALPLAGRVKSW